MALAKELNETYICETNRDRNSIYPYVGQKCIMVNGDLYICLYEGMWSKIGENPIPPTPPTPTYDTWNSLSALSWNDISTTSWNELGVTN